MRRVALAVMLLAMVAAAAAAGWYSALGSALDDLDAEAEADLAIAVARLENGLERFKQLPQVLSEAGPFETALVTRDELAIENANRLLVKMADMTGALDLYLMDREGGTIAASNWDSPQTFVGQNFSYRPYFQRAMEGAFGRYFALGTTSLKRGFYFASAVERSGERLGVIVAKADVDSVEADWRDSGRLVFFTDSAGIVFITSEPALLFRALAPLDPGSEARIAETRQYAGRDIVALPPLPAASVAGHRVVRTAGWGLPAGRPGEALWQSADVGRLDLTAHILHSTAPARTAARTAAILSTLGALVLALAIVVLLQRRQRVLDRLRIEEAAKAELEGRVAARTEALTAEIAEREAAEQALRRTQADLIQASKLSALGQMSAGISHELNQPLAAIRSFAENARVFLERGRVDEASGNLERIGALTARMSRIIGNLRAFARKEGEPATDVALDRVVADTLGLMEQRLEKAGVTVDWTPPAMPVLVRGGEVRLGQVLVNLLANAADAMAQSPERRIRIAVEQGDGVSRLTVADTGPGLGEEASANLFDPFYTTKSVGAGEGLGLGLSISYGIVQSFGGRIRGENAPGGGAIFTVELTSAPPRVEAAE